MAKRKCLLVLFSAKKSNSVFIKLACQPERIINVVFFAKRDLKLFQFHNELHNKILTLN